MNKRELFVVLPDLDAENVVKTLLTERQEALGIALEFCPANCPGGDLLRYNRRDAGCARDAVNILRPVQQSHRHALLLFDHHGSGKEDRAAELLEEKIEEDLFRSGWDEGTVAVVIMEPELEAWVWSGSVHVPKILGWESDGEGLRSFLRQKNFWRSDREKPDQPKEAMETALRHKRQPGGRAPLFLELAEKVSVKHCSDRSFNKFARVLQKWFPRPSGI